MSDSNDTHTAREGEYLSFRLGSEEYGIPILTVQEIRGYQEPTRIVNSPPAIKGVVNLRGDIVPIVDLRIQFQLEQVVYNEITATIVLNLGQRVIGVVVDSVSDVVALQAGQIKHAPEMRSGVDTDYVTGMATMEQGDDSRLLILVNIEKLISGTAMGLAQTAEVH